MQIKIRGEAMAVNATEDEEITGENLRNFDGIGDNARFSDYFHKEQEELTKSAGINGGYLKFVYEEGKLFAETTYECKRELDEKEKEILIEYTQGQWSDGVGEGFEQQEHEGAYISPWFYGQTVEVIYLP
jgi:hypothetical protein